MSHLFRDEPLAVPACLLLIMAILSCVAPAAEVEYQVKGVFLFQFTKFMEWPAEAFANPDAPIVIAILGDDPFGRGLDEAIKNEKSQGRRLEIRRIRRVEDARGCHVLFVSRSENRRLTEILNQLKGSAVLTVGEDAGFARRGGIIEFVLVEGKVRFAINLAAEKQAGLKISSEIKRLATEITRE